MSTSNMGTNKRISVGVRKRRISWGIMTFFAVAVAIWASARYWTFDPSVSAIPENPKVGSHFLVLAFHAITGGIALFVGPFQFSERIRRQIPILHRILGRAYVVCVLLAGLFGLFSAVVSTSGFVAQLGFGGLAVVWIYSVIRAYTAIRQGRILDHRVWMIRNFTLTLAAVSLRIWLGLGIMILVMTGQYAGATPVTTTSVYVSAAWISWVLPLVVSEWFILPRYLHQADSSSASN